MHEESPAISHPSSVSRLGTSLVPESPGNFEGHSNISGTTVLPQDSSSEDEPIILVDELPDLQSAANRLLDLFVSNASDPRNILDSVKRITNPTNTDSKRLKRAAKKLVGIMSRFSSQGFIDVAQMKEMIPSVRRPGAAQPWSPLPILHKANCARLALDVLLASIGTQSPRQAVERLERHFPTPFLDSIVNSQPKPAGASTAKKQTFELALEIRTQYFLMELERRQNEKDFDPRSILKGVFYEELALEEDQSATDPGSLRGFKLKPIFEDENGRLPESYQEDVIDRISELEYDLFDQDDLPNIQSLKRASWSRFVLRTARFIHSRDKEILSDLRQQPKIDEVQDLVTKEIERRRDPASHDTPDRRAEAVPETVNLSSRASLPREEPRPPREPSLRAPPGQDRQSSSPELLSWGPSPGRQRPEATSARSPAHDLHRRRSKGYVCTLGFFNGGSDSWPACKWGARLMPFSGVRKDIASKKCHTWNLSTQAVFPRKKAAPSLLLSLQRIHEETKSLSLLRRKPQHPGLLCLCVNTRLSLSWAKSLWTLMARRPKQKRRRALR